MPLSPPHSPRSSRRARFVTCVGVGAKDEARFGVVIIVVRPAVSSSRRIAVSCFHQQRLSHTLCRLGIQYSVSISWLHAAEVVQRAPAAV